MKREALEKLRLWKSSASRKPLIVQGARQVGKTWLIQEFGRAEFAETAYLSFMDSADMKEVFEGNLNPERLLDAISLATGCHAGREDVLVVFDEIQECPRALMSLKMFCEQRPEVPIIAAGSLLGIALHEGVSFPVGKVEYLNLYPMTFPEYLDACGKESLADLVRRYDFDLLNAFSERFTEELKRYYFVGGMPEAVKTFAEGGDYARVREVQKRILLDYEYDFSKHAAADMTEKIRLVWHSIPAQLARENKKFIYQAVRAGARARGYEEAIQWLLDAGLVYRVNRITKAGLPLAGYEDKDAFKLYFLDVGLLGAISGLTASTLINGSALFTEFKGSLTENYVCQVLEATDEVSPRYWSAKNSSGEVDFVFEYEGKIYPVEVKAEENLRAKSLRNFVSTYNLGRGLRLSLSGYCKQEWVTNIPLYAASVLPKVEG